MVWYLIKYRDNINFTFSFTYMSGIIYECDCITGVIVVVKMDGPSYLCKTDEVGEICVNSGATGSQYWGLQGLTNNTFRVQPLGSDGKPIGEAEYTRSGLLGFLGPVRTFCYLSVLCMSL